MNKLTFKDLVPGKLYSCIEYQGDSRPETVTAVSVLAVDSISAVVTNIATGKSFSIAPDYTNFVELPPNYLEIRVSGLRAQRADLDRQILAFEALM